MCEETRHSVAYFLKTQDIDTIVFTSGVTESINIVAYTFILNNIRKENEVLIAITEHHSNIVPWQRICKKKKCKLISFYLKANKILNWKDLVKKLSNHTKFISVSHISNILGINNDIRGLIQYAHKKGIFVLIDGAQSVSHASINLSIMKPDFYVFSSHKMYGPTGLGVLYINQNIKESIANFHTGGGAIKSVNINETVFMPLPQKLEPGTPNISGIIGLKSAINYINTITINNIEKIELHIMNYAENLLKKMENVNLITAFRKSCILCFTLEKIHPHDITTILNEYKIAIRTGFLCAEPLLNYLNIHSINRMSIVFYNTVNEVKRIYYILKKIKWILRK